MPSPPPDQPEDLAKQATASTEHWDEYWRYGFVTSCGESFKGNYQGGLAAVWESFFESVSNGSTILDVGTGNGAIAMIANRLSRRDARGFVIHGIDQADIDPGKSITSDRSDLEGIVFHSRTPAEECGLPGDSVNIACGQYALEYAPLEEAIAELARVCAPGARAMFVMHHSDSVVLETAREEIRLGRLIDDIAFFVHASALLERMQQLANAADLLNNDQIAESRRDQLNQSAATLMRAATDSEHPGIAQTALANVSDAIAQQTRDGVGTSGSIDDYQKQVRANVCRLEDLLNASVDDRKARKILDLFRFSGFACDPLEDVYHQPGTLAGRVLRAKYAS